MIVSRKSLGVKLSILEEVVIDVVVDELPQLANNTGIRRCHSGNRQTDEMSKW
jgi:hypothetical protein